MGLSLSSPASLVILALVLAAITAIAIDLLKKSHQELREAAIEMKAYRESSERQLSVIEKHLIALPQLVHSSPVLPDPGEKTLILAAPETKKLKQPAKPPRLERTRREMSPAVAAVASSVAARIEREHPYAAAQSGLRVMPQSPKPSNKQAFAERRQNATSAKDWNSLLSKSRQSLDRKPDVLPAGYLDASLLHGAAEAGATITGLVVSIGVAGEDYSAMEKVRDVVRSVMESRDFACQSGPDEFVLVSPVRVEDVKFRLSHIAERLLDLQLVSLVESEDHGSGPIVKLAWGCHVAHGEKLELALAKAVDQMQETRVSRHNSPLAAAI
jgi:hypothetical protein